MSEFIIECEYDFDNGWIPGEQREEIVRCRDCRFSLAHGNGCGRNQDIYDAEPDGFCKWGERKEGE